MIKKAPLTNDLDPFKTFVRYCPSGFGAIAVIWLIYKNRPIIFQTVIPTLKMPARKIVGQAFPQCRAKSCAEIDSVIDQMDAYLSGEKIRFPLGLIRLDRCSPFQQKVLRAEHAIPQGRVSSYGLIANHLNKPGGARAVGSALATNPFPIIVPCHRAVRSDGHLGGFQGGIAMKRALLQMEGVAFSGDTHVNRKHFFYVKD